MKDFPPKDTVSYKYSFTVQPNEIDERNHVNNVVYLQWVNDMSDKHWKILSNDELNSKYFWVCIRHEIDYVNQALLNDEITVYTWVGESVGVKSVRFVNIYKENTLLAKIKSTWCLIDAKSHKPTRIKEDILELLE